MSALVLSKRCCNVYVSLRKTLLPGKTKYEKQFNIATRRLSAYLRTYTQQKKW